MQDQPSKEKWSRVVMRRENRQLLERLQPSRLSVLEISGRAWRNFGFKEYKAVYYPEYDVCEAPLSESFDLIIAEQVFEHLLWPYRAGKHVYQMLNPDGYFLISTPFLVRLHDGPVDCTRWTETGLKYFLAECGFPLEKSQTGSWGNRACVMANFTQWVRYDPELHSLYNEPDFPYHVWALAQK
jgi:SAM-dependent methyltransferase